MSRSCDCGQPAGIAAAVDDVYAGHTAGCSIRPKKRVHKGTLQEQLRSWARNRRNYRHLHLGADLLDRAADRIDELEMRLELLSPTRGQSREKQVRGT